MVERLEACPLGGGEVAYLVEGEFDLGDELWSDLRLGLADGSVRYPKVRRVPSVELLAVVANSVNAAIADIGKDTPLHGVTDARAMLQDGQ